MESSSGMASASPSMDIEQEVKCPICLDYLTVPVSVDCGHNFCRGCISEFCEKWEDLGEDLECPLCKIRIKKGNFRPNWTLANIADKFSKECKDQLDSRLEVLRKEKQIILENKAKTENESQVLLGQVEKKRTMTVAVFNQLYQFLERKKTFLLSQLEEMEEEIVTRKEEHMARLVEKLSSLDGLIQEIEENYQSASVLLQDTKRTLERNEKKEAFKNFVAFPLLLTCRIRGFRDVKPLLERYMKQFPANVTLDPDTAHPQLTLFDDLKSVRLGEERQDLPGNPERFDFWNFVLGHEGFTAGRFFWEVTVGSEGGWAVGVAKKSVKRKGWFNFRPEAGIWAVGKLGGQYNAVNSPDYTPLSLKQELKRIRVTLHCAEGLLSFCDADTEDSIYTYSDISFCGETLHPFFYLHAKTHLTISS